MHNNLIFYLIYSENVMIYKNTGLTDIHPNVKDTIWHFKIVAAAESSFSKSSSPESRAPEHTSALSPEMCENSH